MDFQKTKKIMNDILTVSEREDIEVDQHVYFIHILYFLFFDTILSEHYFDTINMAPRSI